MQTTGVLNPSSDPLLNNYVWQSPGNQIEKQPVVRLDYNLSAQPSAVAAPSTRSGWSRDPDHLNSADRAVPRRRRTTGSYGRAGRSRSIALRSTLGSNLVNELRGGITRGGARLLRQARDQRPARRSTDPNGFALDLDPTTISA